MEPTTGYVALIDVLGFKNIVTSPANGEALQKYLRAVEEGTAGKGDSARIQFVLFSDTIVITTADDSDASLQFLLRACSRLFGVLLENEIAIRGAVTHGQYFRHQSDRGVFIAGRPIVEAHQFELAQKWVGLLVTNSVLQRVAKLTSRCSPKKGTKETDADFHRRLPWIALIRRHKTIPFIEGAVDGIALLPTPLGAATAEIPKYLGKCVKKLERLKLLAPDPGSQQKYVSAAKFFQEADEQWKVLTRGTPLPASIPYRFRE